MAEGKRPRELDEQAEYTTGLKLPVDHDSYADGDVKYVLIETIRALINTLDAYPGSLSRSTDLLRVNDDAGNEYKVTIDDIYEIISDLDSLPAPPPDGGDLMRITDITDGLEKKITFTNVKNAIYTLIASLGSSSYTGASYLRFSKSGTEYRQTITELGTYLFALSAFNTAVDARIAADRINEFSGQDLDTGPTTYGVLFYEKSGRRVTVTIGALVSTSGYKTIDNYSIPSSLYPITGSIGISSGEDDNFAEFYNDGTVVLKVTDAAGLRIVGSWITAS